jgi:hypothetical protein
VADNLNMRCISARSVPRLLSDNQKALRVSVWRELKQQALVRELLDRTVYVLP